MINFEFQCPTKIIFGRNTENQIGREVSNYSNKILLHYGGENIKKSGLYDKVIRSLQQSGIEVLELSGVKPNPRLSLIRQGIEICRRNKINFILAVGGGSVIDSAKAIAVGVPYHGDVWDFYTGKTDISDTLPVGVIVTIPAAGSEASPHSVITNEAGLYKRGITDEKIRPRFAILNPEITFSLSRYQTACGVADIMAHTMERYFTSVPSTDLTDRLCEGTLKAVIGNVFTILKEPHNYDARAEIMWAATIAHNDVLGTGREGDWACHMIEHELSGDYDVAHGAGLAVVFPAWMNYVYKQNIAKFVQFAVRVWDVDIAYGSPEEIALEGISRLTKFYKEIGLPTTLKDLGIEDNKLDEMAKKCTESGEVGHMVKLGTADVLNILRFAR